MQITVEIPDQFAQDLFPTEEDAARTLLEGAVASAYRDHRLSTEQARLLLGYGTRMQVNTFLAKHEISIFTIEDLDQDIETHKRLLARKGERLPA